MRRKRYDGYSRLYPRRTPVRSGAEFSPYPADKGE